MNERGGEQLDMARRVQRLEDYCHHGDLALEGVQERIVGIPPDAVRHSNFFLEACGNERVTLEIVEYLLGELPDAARSNDNYERLPLHRACENENLDPRIIRVLLDRWPESANCRDDEGNLPLHTLCHNRSADETAQLAILNLLLSAVPDPVTIVNGMGNLPIHVASGSGKPLLFCKRLIDAYPESPRVRTGNGLLPFHHACYGGEIETVKCLLELYPESIDARDREGDLPIHCAAESDGQHKVDIIRYLLAKDPDSASKAGAGQCLPLHGACMATTDATTVCLDSVRHLFDAYPEAINVGDMHGRTPFDVVSAPELREFLESQLPYVQLAEDTRAMHTVDENGWLPLHRALRNNASLGAVKLLFARNPSALRVSDNTLAYPLHVACEFSTVDVVQYLLGLLDIHLNALDLQKNSALHYACRGGNTGVVKYLLERGVPSVSEPNNGGKLSIHLLWESDRVDRNSVEYVDAVWRLLLAHPETVAL